MPDTFSQEILRRAPAPIADGTLIPAEQLHQQHVEHFRFNLLENLRVAYEGMLALGGVVHSIDWAPEALEATIQEYPSLREQLELFPDLVIAQDNLEDLLNQVAAALGIQAGFDYGLESIPAIGNEVHFLPGEQVVDAFLPSTDALKQGAERRFRKYLWEQLEMTHRGLMALKSALNSFGDPQGFDKHKADYPEFASFLNLYSELQAVCLTLFELLNHYGDFSIQYEQGQLELAQEVDPVLE